MNLQLPGYAVPDRISITRPLEANACYTYANLDGPGMIQTIRVAVRHPKLAQASRKAIIPICFGDEVERPEGGPRRLGFFLSGHD